MADPITLGAVGTAIAAGVPLLAKAIKAGVSLMLHRIDDLEDKLHSDHEENRSRVLSLGEDIQEIKTDVAVVKTEIVNLKERQRD